MRLLARLVLTAVFLCAAIAPAVSAPYRPRSRLRTAVRAEPIPAFGPGHAWSQDMRRLVAFLMDNRLLSGAQWVTQLQQNWLFPRPRTLRDYRRRRRDLGHLLRFRRTGNRFARVLRHTDLIHLAVWRVLYPRGTHAEANVFLWNAGGRRRFYAPSQLTLAEQRIGLTRTRASTTAREAFLPRNLQIRWNYWNLPYPFGIADIRRDDIIDLDEAGVFIETSNRSYGKAARINRVRDEGPYGHSQRLNLLMAVSAARGNGGAPAERWVDLWTTGGTTIRRFVQFIQRILNDIGPGTPARRRVFIMDNLTSHRNRLVLALIRAAGHRVVFRAPYYPVDGPIEYIFNTIQQALTLAMYRIHDGDELRDELLGIIALMNDFAAYFVHCGYNHN